MLNGNEFFESSRHPRKFCFTMSINYAMAVQCSVQCSETEHHCDVMLRRQGSIRDMCAIKTSLILLFFWVISSQQRNCTPLELSSGFFLLIAKFPVRVCDILQKNNWKRILGRCFTFTLINLNTAGFQLFIKQIFSKLLFLMPHLLIIWPVCFQMFLCLWQSSNLISKRACHSHIFITHSQLGRHFPLIYCSFY